MKLIYKRYGQTVLCAAAQQEDSPKEKSGKKRKPKGDDADDDKKKKARTTFTGRQIFELEKQFEQKKYLSSSERSSMAKLLNVTETQVREGGSEEGGRRWEQGRERERERGFVLILNNHLKAE